MPTQKIGHLGAFYNTGPIFGFGIMVGQTENSSEQDKEKSPSISPLQGHGSPRLVTVSGNGNTIRIRGRTDAQFDGGRFETRNVRERPGHGCRNCPPSECINVRGTLVSRYRVTTTVTLPSADDYPDLTECQRQRVRDAINNKLAPHEQKHVRAFGTYNGTTQRHFDLTLARSEFAGVIRSMFETEERERRSAAQEASDALDPFYVDIELNCEDEQEDERESHESGGGDGDDDTED